MGIFRAVQFNTLTNLLDTTTQFDPSLIYPLSPPSGLPLTALGALTNGSLVSLVDNGGTLQATLANASASCANPALPAHGFILASYTNGQPVQVFLGGVFTAPVPGATIANIGSLVFLSDSTPGGVSLTPPLPTKTWLPNTVYSAADTIVDTNGNWETAGIGGGTSGATEPPATPPGGGGAWAVICGNTTVDNTITWTMSPPHYEQIVGTIVYFNSVSGQCTILFQPLLNIGNVTSVALTMPADFAVGGSPIITAGTLQVTWQPQSANKVHAGPTSGGAAIPTWRLLVAADIPNLDASKITTGQIALARGGTAADLSATGSSTAVLAQDASHVISARSLIATDIPNLDAAKITTGQIALARGGTNADLSGTGGTSFVLRQSSVGATITVSQLAASDLSDGTTGSGAVVLASSPTLLGTPVVGLISYTVGISNSPALTIAGSYENTAGPTYAEDSWTIQDVVGAGVNGTSVLTFTHSGSSGASFISVPALTATGTVQGATLTATGALNVGTNQLIASSSGIITTYGGVVTAANGVGSILVKYDAATQSAALSVVSLIASTPFVGQYRISWSAVITTAATTGAGTSTLGGATGFQVTYTDVDTTAPATTPAAGVPAPTNTAYSQTNQNNTVGTQVSGVVVVNATLSSAITFSFGYTSDTAAQMVYAIHIKVEYLG